MSRERRLPRDGKAVIEFVGAGGASGGRQVFRGNRLMKKYTVKVVMTVRTTYTFHIPAFADSEVAALLKAERRADEDKADRYLIDVTEEPLPLFRSEILKGDD